MTKSGLIVLLCLILTSGCASFDSAEVTGEPPSATLEAAASEASTEPPIVEVAPVEAPVVTTRSFTQDEMRRMQLLLRDVGFNPGPIDGIAGAKTKAAAARFQAACSKANGVIERWADVASTAVGESEIPNAEETRTIQAQLKSAGLNPGAVDGIFGSRTRALLMQLKNGCPLIADFAQSADQVAEANRSAGGGQRPQSGAGRFPVSRALPGNDEAKQPGLALARSQEEVRILQLQLRDAGFDPGPFDGIMGPKTRAALEQYLASRKGKKTSLISGFNGQY